MSSLSPSRPKIVHAGSVLAAALVASSVLGAMIGTIDRAMFVVAALLALSVGLFVAGKTWGAALAIVPVLLTSRTDLIGPVLPNIVLASLGLLYFGAYCVRARYLPRLPMTTLAFLAFSLSVLLLSGLAGQSKIQPTVAVGMELTLGLLLGQLIRNRNQVLGGIGFVVLPLSLLAMVEVVTRTHLWPTALNGHGVALEISGSEGWRAVSSFGHPLVAGGMLAILAVFVWTAWQSPHRSWVAAGLFLGALATVTRSALLALAAAVVAALILTEARPARRFWAVVVLVVATTVAVTAVPQLRESYDTRVLKSTEEQTIRREAVRTARTYLVSDTGRAAVGTGIGTANELLERRGGIEGFTTFDNQYIALVYDLGWLVMLVFAGWAAVLIVRGGREHAARSVPPLIAVLTVAAFTDSLTWASLAVTSYAVLGYAISRPARSTAYPTERL